MTIQAPTIRAADDFLAAFEGVEGKRGFVNGKIVELAIGVTRNQVDPGHRARPSRLARGSMRMPTPSAELHRGIA